MSALAILLKNREGYLLRNSKVFQLENITKNYCYYFKAIKKSARFYHTKLLCYYFVY